MFSRPWVLILLVLLIALVFWQRLSTERSQLSRTALIMGTLVEIQVNGDDLELLERAVTEAIAEMTRLEQLFSTHIPQSEINRLSDARTMQVSVETADLLTLGRKIARSSQGAFDMCLGNLKRLWDIENQAPKIPAEKDLREALLGIGPESLRIEGRQVTKQTERLRIDLGGIAKGYVVDRAVEILRAAGVFSAAVNAGGDIRLLGDRQGRPWRIGIQHPRQNGEVVATLALQDRAVVTSGDYERYFEQDGIRYHHLFDPKTGRPARGCQSVTVVAVDAASADALATAAFVLGPEKGLALLEQMPEVEGFLIAADGSRLTTSGLEGFLEWH